ncbi:3-dehydroquinate synthase [bacterium E08(2017)]|nr:3-dehydroquinate synthase [bacterium E08(2017)]
MDVYKQEFEVKYEYPVYFTSGVFDPENMVLKECLDKFADDVPRKVLVYIDDGVAEAHPGLPEMVTAYLEQFAGVFEIAKEPEEVPGGERTKNGWNVVQNIMASMGAGHLCRQSIVIAIGGGSVLDMVGFAASLVHRGVRIIRIPTTVLAQGDGGVGVKTGMDEHGQKNFVGTFAPPAAVINDFEFLKTLDDKYWRGGLAEAFKVAITKDADFFDYLCEHADDLMNRDDEVIKEVVKRSAILHLEHIRNGGDPFEFGTARPLDFGHWAAHRLEIMSNYRIAHGQAVALGIAIDSFYAARKGMISEDDLERIVDAFLASGLPVWDKLMENRDGEKELSIVRGLEEFREHLGGKLTITLPDGIGSKVEVHEMDVGVIVEAVDYLGSRQ